MFRDRYWCVLGAAADKRAGPSSFRFAGRREPFGPGVVAGIFGVKTLDVIHDLLEFVVQLGEAFVMGFVGVGDLVGEEHF